MELALPRLAADGRLIAALTVGLRWVHPSIISNDGGLRKLISARTSSSVK